MAEAADRYGRRHFFPADDGDQMVKHGLERDPIETARIVWWFHDRDFTMRAYNMDFHAEYSS